MGFFPLSKLYQDHKKFFAEREFEAMKECVSGKRKSFGRVSIITFYQVKLVVLQFLQKQLIELLKSEASI